MGEMQTLLWADGQALSLPTADIMVHMMVIGNAAKAARLADAKHGTTQLKDLLEVSRRFGGGGAWQLMSFSGFL